MTNTALNQASGKDFTLYHGDCVEVLQSMPENSIDLTVTSPPYFQLYVYSNSERDMGNSKDEAEFLEHFGFMLEGLYRATKPGRVVAIDCMNVPAMKARDGYIGVKDFRGDLIRAMERVGFIFHSEHCIWKDPLLEATRTKSIGLMHKQLCKDSAMSRSGIPQYLLAFRKPGENMDPIAKPNGLELFVGNDEPTQGNLSHERWRRYASPVWTDINFSRTLNFAAARDKDDEKHICPMALDIIERAIHLWSNESEVVFDPFSGIGSTGYSSLRMSRKSVGSELKESYWNLAVKNLRDAEQAPADMFSAI